MRFSIVLAALAMSSLAFAQLDISYQIGYAANLNVGDSVVNISNSGAQGGFYGATPVSTIGNICVNAYVFDPQEEEIGCCACLTTPNGLYSLSVKSDLTSNNLTPASPTSAVIKLLATEPGLDGPTQFTLCNPATINVTGTSTFGAPYYGGTLPFPAGDPSKGILAIGMLAWGATPEPSVTPGTYSMVNVPFINSTLSPSELFGLQQVCQFIQSNGTGYGICKSCRIGALGGAKN